MERETPIDTLIGTMEAADILGLNRVTVWRLAQSGKLKPAIVRERGRREILFSLADVRDYAERRASAAEESAA